MSRYWYKADKSVDSQTFDITNQAVPRNYLNMLFFQYWSTFFSSMLIFFALVNLYLVYGCTDFTTLNVLSFIKLNLFSADLVQILLVWFPLFFGFFLKIGITPFHLFKIEVYKGLPLVSILFYTTFYFFIYFLFFYLLVSTYISAIKLHLFVILYLLVVTGTLYIISLIFDIFSVKAFFAYSTIINALLFITALLIY